MKLNWRASFKNIIVALGGTAAVLALVVGLLQIFASYDVANRSNAFDSPELALKLYNIPLQPNTPTDVFVGTEGGGNVLTISALWLSLQNVGKKTQNNVNILQQYPGAIKDKSLEDASVFSYDFPQIPRYNPTRLVTFLPKWTICSYSIQVLDPGLNLRLPEPFLVQQTSFHENVSATTRDGVPVTVGLDVQMSIPVNLTITGQDLKSSNYPLRLRTVAGSNPDDFVTTAFGVLLERVKEYRQKTGFFEYLKTIIWNTYFPVILYIAPVEDKSDPAGGAAMHVHKYKDAKVYSWQYPLAHWRLLVAAK